MSISKKPKTTPSSQSEAEVQALIEKGGSAARQEKKNNNKKQQKDIVPISLRLPRSFSERIETVLEKRALKVPRHTWLLEAIVEKLEREEK
ncbi:hypothetical protein IQ255_20285 [Pleurocapsales cyanobacterium LEGE 10410]|nr:hypothetical protein [Pleurocapsales cyanobacterium LEGE 10410]